MSETFDEATLDLLRLTIPTYGILVPVIYRSGTNEIIDGRHRLKVREELEAEGVRVMLPVHHVDTDNPAEIDQIVNSVRRPWQDTKQRRKLVVQLREKGHSHKRIADAVGTAKSTVQDDLSVETAGGRNRPPADQPFVASTGKDGRKQASKKATPEEIARAWAMKDSGMSTSAIAKDLGRGERTVRDWFAKEHPKAIQAKRPPAPEPAPQALDNPALAPRDPSLPLPELSNKLIASEKKAAAKRTAALANLAELNADMEKLWKAAQRHFEKEGRSVLRNHQGLADQKMVTDGVLKSQCEAIGISADSSYFELLRAIDAAGKKLSQSARQAIYLFGYTDTLEP